jgi:hypothetical protein
MVAFRHFTVAVCACAFVAMNAGVSIALDPVKSIEAFAVDRNAVLVVPCLAIVNTTAVDAPAATNTTTAASFIDLEDLFASSLWKTGPFAVTHEERESNSTDLFASSILQSASASRRLKDSYDIASSLWLDASRRTSRRLRTVMDDIKPLTRDSVDNVLASFANTLQAHRAAFRYAIATLTSKALVPTAFLSPEILNILSKQCPLIVTTCEVDAMDDIKPLAHDSVDNVLAWFANTLQAPRAAFRYAIAVMTSKAPVPTAFFLPEILNVLSKQCPLIVTTCEVDVMDATKPLTVLQALRIASRYAITAMTIGSIAFFCIMIGSWQILLGWVCDDPLNLLILVVGTMVVALVVEYVTDAIWYYYWLVFIHVDVDDDLEDIADALVDVDDALEDVDDVLEDVDDALEDVDDALEDVDDGVAVHDDVPVEAPVERVRIAMIAAPLRRSKRVAAQGCLARRSTRLAAKPRVNYKH